MKLQNRVRELRAKHRISQGDLGKAIGSSRQTISLIERGDYAPSIVLSLKIAHIFNVPVEEIFMLVEGKRTMKSKQSAIVKLLIGAVLGGVIGYIGGDIATTSTRKVPSVVSIVMMIVLGVGAIYYIWKRTKTLLQMKDEESGSGRRLGIVLIYLRVMEIVVMSWFVCSVISVYKAYVDAENLFWVIVSLTMSTVGFMITTLLGSVTRKNITHYIQNKV